MTQREGLVSCTSKADADCSAVLAPLRDLPPAPVCLQGGSMLSVSFHQALTAPQWHCCPPTRPASHASVPACPAQGESDAFDIKTAAAYGIHFAAWLSATRAALAPYAPCEPVVMAVMATRQRQGAFPYIDVLAQ